MNETLHTIHQLNKQAWSDRNMDIQRSLSMAQQAQGMLAGFPAESIRRELALSLCTQGYCLEQLSRYAEALTTSMQAMQLASQVSDLHLVATIDNVLGNIYWRLSDYSSSLDHFMHGLRLIQVEPDPELETFMLQGLGALHHEMGDHEEALKYFSRSTEVVSPENIIGRALGLNNIAYTLHEMNRDQEALPYALQALDLLRGTPVSVGKLDALHTLGSIYLQLEDVNRASHYFEEALQTAEEHNNLQQIIDSSFGICQIHQRRGELDAARQKLHRILEIATDIGSLVSECHAHELLAQIYKQTGDFQTALAHHEKFHAIHVQIFNEQSERRLHNTQVLLEVEAIRKQANLYRMLAATDSLTGLLSRREFFELGEKVIHQARFRHIPVSLMMIDMDNFKTINDQHGHAMGDQVLSIVAGRLKSTLRQDDLAGRYGGDEFVILMPDISLLACQRIAERCRKVVAEEPIVIDPLKMTMNISIGLVVLEVGDTQRLEDLIQQADRALLIAKREGRNRVVSSTSL